MSLSTKHPVRNTDPAYGILVVTPSDTVPLKEDLTPSRGISVGAAGDVNFVMADGSTGIAYLAAGILHPIRATYVKNASTGATGIVAWF